MPTQNPLRNPVLLARRLEAAEISLHRQVVLNQAAADKLIAYQDRIDALGSYIIALVHRLGGRAEFTPEQLGKIAAGGFKVHYSYPDEKHPTFAMVLSAEGTSDPRKEQELEAKLRAAGMSEEEIAQLKRKVDEATEQAEAVFGEGAPTDPPTPPPEEG
jgi:hypothetical protein